MARFGAVRVFGYNSAESEPIWMKSRALRVHYWGLALADILFQVSNTRLHLFLIGQISRNLKTACRSLSRWKLLEQNF